MLVLIASVSGFLFVSMLFFVLDVHFRLLERTTRSSSLKPWLVPLVCPHCPVFFLQNSHYHNSIHPHIAYHTCSLLFFIFLTDPLFLSPSSFVLRYRDFVNVTKPCLHFSFPLQQETRRCVPVVSQSWQVYKQFERFLNDCTLGAPIHHLRISTLRKSSGCDC